LVPEDVELVIDASGTALVWADANAIGQMLVNLAANARDAMTGSGGSVRVSVGVRAVAAVEIPADALVVPGRFVTIEVRDTGTGMDEATLARAFDPFFTTKAAGLGTGLGLPMVKGLMAEHGGFVQIESAPGQGTIVRLLFCPADGEETAAGALPDEAPRKGTETILIAEDEEALRRVATRALEQLGYRVLTAADGQEALVLYHAHADEIDLVISDSVMPRLGGIAFHETLRREGSRVRFLLASGYAPDDRGRHGDVGVPFLAKPWTLSELTAKVREVLDGPAPR
jgi:CheY-like chemotaxis protein